MEDGYKLQVTSKKYKNYTNYTWQTCVTQKIQTTPARSCKFQNCHPPPKKKETQDHNGGPATKCVVSNISGRPSCRWKSQGPWGGEKTKKNHLVGGFNPLKLWVSQLGWWTSQYMENMKNVPYHQPVMCECGPNNCDNSQGCWLAGIGCQCT